jgi:hypothetical protein
MSHCIEHPRFEFEGIIRSHGRLSLSKPVARGLMSLDERAAIEALRFVLSVTERGERRGLSVAHCAFGIVETLPQCAN